MSFPEGPHTLTRLNYREAVAAGRQAELDAAALGGLDASGFVVIEEALPGEDCDQLLAEMAPFLDATPHGLHGLGGTRRCGALVARSPTSHKMISHPAVLSLVNSVLGEQQLRGDAVRIGGHKGKGDTEKGFAYPWQLHLTQIIDVGPGGGTDAFPHQFGASNGDPTVTNLHKANGMWVHNFQDDGLDLQVEVMWALTDFTEDNGATHAVLGSHREEPRDGPFGYKQPTVQAVMPKGSVVVWTGWSIHGAGVNTSSVRRTGMNINYSLAFLAQEENQLLACPPHLARNLSPEMQRLIGYFQPSGSLNYVAECQSPADSVLREGYDVLVPGAHLHRLSPDTQSAEIEPAPSTAEGLEAKVADLQEAKRRAIDADDLELALHYKNATTVLLQRAELLGDGGGGGEVAGVASTAALLKRRFGQSRM